LKEESPGGANESSNEVNSYYKDQRPNIIKTPYLDQLKKIFSEVEEEFKRTQAKRTNAMGTIERDI